MSIIHDYQGGLSTVTRDEVDLAVIHARTKHKIFPKSWFGKFLVLFEEIFELVKAVVIERKIDRIKAEALDCVAVLIRIIEDD